MKPIDTSTWKEFHMSDIGFKIFHGIRQKQSDRTEGDTPLLTAGKENQGVASYIGNPPSTYTDSITVDMFGNSFFHKGVYAGDDNIYFFVNDCISDEAKLFIAAIINTDNTPKYAFKDQFRQPQADALSVHLPVTPLGEPDWQYMENYMKAIETKTRKKLSSLSADRAKQPVDTSTWKEFRVGDLFDVHPTKSYKMTNSALIDGGKNPVIVNSAFNNGVGGYSSQEVTEKGNMITFSDTVDANTIFYQKEPFIGYAHVQGLYPKGDYANKWREESLIFFATAFKNVAVAKGFDYGNKFRRDIAITLKIKLPTTLSGDPDWQYMENYMRAKEQEARKKLQELSNIIQA